MVITDNKVPIALGAEQRDELITPIEHGPCMARNENDGRVLWVSKGLVADANSALGRESDEEFWRGVHFLGSLGSGVLCVGCALGAVERSGVVDTVD